MTFGNLAALRQTNIVRMLAYSSIAQGGFMLVPFAAAGSTAPRRPESRASRRCVIYLLIYGAMNLGAFAVVIAVARRTRIGRDRHVRRPVPDVARPRGDDDHLPVVARRYPAARGLVRQVRDVPRHARRRHAVGDRARGRRGGQLGDRVLLLRGRGPRDVVPRPGARGHDHAAARSPPRSPCAIGLTRRGHRRRRHLPADLRAGRRAPPCSLAHCGRDTRLLDGSLSAERDTRSAAVRSRAGVRRVSPSSCCLAGDEVRHARHGERDQPCSGA